MAEAPERTTVTKEVEKTKDKEGKLMETLSSPEKAPLKPEEAENKPPEDLFLPRSSSLGLDDSLEIEPLQSARMTADSLLRAIFRSLLPASAASTSSSSSGFVGYSGIKPQSSRMTEEQEEENYKSLLKHMRHISKEIVELSTMEMTEKLSGQYTLMEKLIKEQKQLVNFQQEMAASVEQRATDSQLDQQTSRDLSELFGFLSKIHLVSLKLNIHRMKSVDEAQTDTKVSEKQNQLDKMEEALSKLEWTLRHLGLDRISPDYTPPHVRKYETKQYMIERVYYCQQMLVDDLQGLAQQTLLDKEPAYQEQYMKNLNVLINTQQQLVQNLTDLQKQKKGSKLEKESSKQEDLPAGEIGKQQIELELINEQTNLVEDCLHWVQCHRGWQGSFHMGHDIGHSIFMAICSVHTVHRAHGKMSHGIDHWKHLMESVIDFIDKTIYGENEKFVKIEMEIMLSQIRFLDRAQVGTKRRVRQSNQDDSTAGRHSSSKHDHPLIDVRQSKEKYEERDLEGLKISLEETSLSGKEEEQALIESGGSPEATILSDVTVNPLDEDSNLDAITQTTQTVTQMAQRNEQTSIEFGGSPEATIVSGATKNAVTRKGQRPELTKLCGELKNTQNDDPEPILPFPKDLTLTDIETEVLFREVAEQLGEDWERLATYLGHRRSDLYAVKRDNADDVRDQIFCMLVRWQQELGPFGKNAFDTLSSSLKRIERNDIVEFLKRRVTRIPHEQRRNKGEGTDDEDLNQQLHRAKLSTEEDSNLGAAGHTSITQTTQAVTQMVARNEPLSHLEEVLNEFDKQTKIISAKEKTDILLQLPYMAVGFFNNLGGTLALKKYDVHLYIPHGAIPEGPPKLVYIYVNPDEIVAEKVNSEEKQLSPEVQCGPPGLTFKDSVVLSFPHHADSSGWKFTAKMCPASSAAWQALDSSIDGQLVSAQGGRAIFLVDHFTGFALFGTSSGSNGICVRVGAFGGIFDLRSYTFRVYMWKDDRVSEERVEELERKLRSEMLDTYKNMIFVKDRGHMHVEMTETVEGWEVRPQTIQEIREEDVWAFSQNSVSFNVRIRGGIKDEIPYMAVNCYQQQEGDDGQGRQLLLDVGPKLAQMRNNNLIHTCDALQRRMCDAAHSIRASCHTDGSGDNTMPSKPMTEVTNAISSVIRRRPCEEVRMFGGLSDQKVNDLCEFLDNQAAGDRGLPLLDYLSGNGYILPNTPKKEVLSRYFSLCLKHNIADQDAVQYLNLVFNELNYTRAAEIIEPGGERTDAESILQFLDNESLTKGDAEICLRDLAKKLGPEWEDLATYLGIINSELTAVRSECAGRVNGQIFCMLVIWMQRFGPFGEAAFNTLSSNLGRVERNDLVELLKGKVASILFFNRQTTDNCSKKVNKGSSS
ncbi:uncharacterized protein [Asterias amurensis]|uniref:uncharacterized protein isoform X2 n=1 Tax=Asterias amurensis TaxID=7602 RepID=UPI003AB70D46